MVSYFSVGTTNISTVSLLHHKSRWKTRHRGSKIYKQIKLPYALIFPLMQLLHLPTKIYSKCTKVRVIFICAFIYMQLAPFGSIVTIRIPFILSLCWCQIQIQILLDPECRALQMRPATPTARCGPDVQCCTKCRFNVGSCENTALNHSRLMCSHKISVGPILWLC